MASKFKILEKVSNAYCLKLPLTMKIHPIFSPNKLYKASTDLLPGQVNEPAELVVINGEEEWEVEELLDLWIY